MDITIGPNQVLDMKVEEDGQFVSPASSSYEYVAGSDDSPYVITSSFDEFK